jgi:hypothetical protein
MTELAETSAARRTEGAGAFRLPKPNLNGTGLQARTLSSPSPLLNGLSEVLAA